MLRRGLLCLSVVLLASCSVKRYAIHQMGDAMAGTGDTFARDDDPELIRSAAPFSLKLVESLLAKEPRHEGLLLAASRGFTQYAYAFVQEDSDEMEDRDRAGANALRIRAAKLYLRARDYGLRGLEVRHKDFATRLKANPADAVKELKKADVPLMYWTAVAWAEAISTSRDFAMLPEIPRFEALTMRALELDEAYENGALHTFLIAYEMARLNKAPNSAELAKQHFDRAVALGQGHHAGPWVAYAEHVTVPLKNRSEFEALLKQAVQLNLNTAPDYRQLNMIMQRRARWLLSRTDRLFPK